MLITIDGAKGSGKTYLMAQQQKKDSATMPVLCNYDLFSIKDVKKFHYLHQIFGQRQTSIGIDEGPKYFDARKFMSFPPQFAEMVAGDRHDDNKIYITTQGFDHIDKRVRQNTDILISVNRIYRWPSEQNQPAIIQISRYKKFKKKIDNKGRVRWVMFEKKFFLISKFFKKFYNTYEKISGDDYFLKIKWKKKKPTIMLISRGMIESGKKRL
jgi:hypothetical protein